MPITSAPLSHFSVAERRSLEGMDERRILSTTRQSSTEIVRTTFTTLRKGGIDPQEVRLHLETVAREMGHLENRIRELQEQLSEAQRRAANPTFDEATLASALGAQSAAILRSAHEEAGRVTAEAQERSALVFSESQQRGRRPPHRGPRARRPTSSPRPRHAPTRSTTTRASPPSG